MLGECAAEALLGSTDWSVDKAQLGYVVFVNHGKNGFALNGVHNGVLHVGCVCGLQLSISVIRDDVFCLLLGTTVISFEC